MLPYAGTKFHHGVILSVLCKGTICSSFDIYSDNCYFASTFPLRYGDEATIGTPAISGKVGNY